ncbi:MAG: response regulator [Candidatus Marinimicrobia bacterium]|nr:response regulator [Candidatus Neomarinimicrobiota bacterium]
MNDSNIVNRKKSILIIDDDISSLNLLSFFFKKLGYQTHIVSNALKAIDRATSTLPDLILLDIKMLDMDGFEVCRKLKKNEITRSIPVIFISVLGEVLDKVKAFSVGGVDYITKPFEFEEVQARVQSHLTIRNLQKRLQEQNIELQMEVEARIAAVEELRHLNEELEQRVKERTMKLGVEQERSQKLLLNILPENIVEQLKLSDEIITENFMDVSVLFADIVNYTEMSSDLSSSETVNLLNRIFTTFDELAEKYGLEKIKTIGDSYMLVGGLPEKLDDHFTAVAEMALDMQNAMSRLSKELGKTVQIRIGINSGPVTAGVIGKKKFIYDLWGDTVNTASRMESCGLAGDIQVTKETYTRLKDRYIFKKRSIINIKGKGKMNTFLLKRRRQHVPEM